MGDMAYNRKKTKTYLLRFVYTTDADIISRLDTVGNKQGYIKRLIRADIAANCPDIDEMIVKSETGKKSQK